MRRTLIKRISFIAPPLVLLLAGGTVMARGWHHGPERMKWHVKAVLDDALDDAPLTKEQEKAVDAALEQATRSFGERREARQLQMTRALALFASDKVDPAEVGLKAAHRAQAEEMSGAVTSAVLELHDILTPAQRKAVVTYLREEFGDKF